MLYDMYWRIFVSSSNKFESFSCTTVGHVSFLSYGISLDFRIGPELKYLKKLRPTFPVNFITNLTASTLIWIFWFQESCVSVMKDFSLFIVSRSTDKTGVKCFLRSKKIVYFLKLIRQSELCINVPRRVYVLWYLRYKRIYVFLPYTVKDKSSWSFIFNDLRLCIQTFYSTDFYFNQTN